MKKTTLVCSLVSATDVPRPHLRRSRLEDSAWAGGHGAILPAGARPVPVPVDEDGLRMDLGIAAAPRARLGPTLCGGPW